MTTTWSRAEAWWGLALNALVFPGLGTVMVSRAWAGFAQTIGGVCGLALVLAGQAAGWGLLLGVAAWSIDSSLRAVRRAG